MHFNNVDIKQYAKILKIERDILPPIRNESINIPGKHGSMFIKNKLGERIIRVRLELKGINRRNVYSKAREFLTKLYTTEPAELWFEDEPEMYYKAVLNGNTNMELIYLYGIIDLEFICNDPFIYLKPKVVKYDHSITGSKVIKIYNDSDYIADTKFNLTIGYPEARPQTIQNLTNGTGIRTTVAIKTMTMDSAKHLTIINGEIANSALSFTSSYITLAPGWNEIDFFNVRSEGSIEYTERRL